MREIADQVFAQSAAADSTQLRSKLAVLNDRLTSLLRICGQYKQLLDGALRNRGASMSPSTPSGLNLSPSSAGSRTPHQPIVVLPSTEVCVYLNHVFFMALINIGRSSMIYDFINFFYKHNNYDTVFIWTSSYSQLVDHRLRDFHALRLWTSARLPALSIPSTAPFLFELLNLLFTPMQLSCLSLSISTHRNC